MIDFKTIETQQKQVLYTLITMSLVVIPIAVIGGLFLTHHEMTMILVGLAIGAVATIASLFIPS